MDEGEVRSDNNKKSRYLHPLILTTVVLFPRHSLDCLFVFSPQLTFLAKDVVDPCNFDRTFVVFCRDKSTMKKFNEAISPKVSLSSACVYQEYVDNSLSGQYAVNSQSLSIYKTYVECPF